jgi:anti-sigma B factor antagonist
MLPGRQAAEHPGPGVTWRGHKRLLSVELEMPPRAAILRLHGSAGITEIAALRVALESLVRQNVPTIVLDLSDLHYVASIAVSAVAAGICQASADRNRIRLAAPSPGVLDVLTKSRVNACVHVYPSVAAAMGSPSSPEGCGDGGIRQHDSTYGLKKDKRLPLPISVACDNGETATAVPVRTARKGILKRLAARIAGHAPRRVALPRSA